MRRITAVEARSVTRTFGTTLALRGVSARLEAGTITVIEGPNGSGKSTLLGILGTAVRPTSGTVTWEPYGEDPAEARPCIGWLSHEALVYPDLPGTENLRWAARLHGLGDGAVSRVAERVGLGNYAQRPVRTYSRGQRQRVALARALVHAPSLLLLDEPTTGLDRDGVELLVRLVREEAERGAVVAVVAHDPGLADRLGAKSLRLLRGRTAPEERPGA